MAEWAGSISISRDLRAYCPTRPMHQGTPAGRGVTPVGSVNPSGSGWTYPVDGLYLIAGEPDVLSVEVLK